METRETITLDAHAQQRMLVLTHVLAGELSLEDAAGHLGISVRQVQRLVSAVRTEGAAVLLHGNRGRAPANRVADEQRARLLELARTTYAGFNPEHMAETVAEEHPELAVSARTLRRVLAEAGISAPRTRRSPAHRSRRERMPRAGMLLQTDGSDHDWLEGRGPRLTLVGGIDDATGVVPGATFRAHEDAAGYFLMLGQTARRVGLPLALYTDRHGIFTKATDRPPTLTEQLTGQRSLTQVGRALDEVGVRWIGAHSPQAKGRIERAWGTLQDRLVSELRRAGAADLETANVVLARYLPRHNARFAVPAAVAEPAWRPWTLPWPIESVLCFHYPRRVANDATLPWDGASLQLPRRSDGRSWAGRRVIVEERLDGSLWARTDDGHHRLQEAPASAPLLRARHRDRLDALEEPVEPARPEPVSDTGSSARPTSRPGPEHPWRRYPAVRPR
jgi:transposase